MSRSCASGGAGSDVIINSMTAGPGADGVRTEGYGTAWDTVQGDGRRREPVGLRGGVARVAPEGHGGGGRSPGGQARPGEAADRESWARGPPCAFPPPSTRPGRRVEASPAPGSVPVPGEAAPRRPAGTEVRGAPCGGFDCVPATSPGATPQHLWVGPHVEQGPRRATGLDEVPGAPTRSTVSVGAGETPTQTRTEGRLCGGAGEDGTPVLCFKALVWVPRPSSPGPAAAGLRPRSRPCPAEPTDHSAGPVCDGSSGLEGGGPGLLARPRPPRPGCPCPHVLLWH